MKRPTTATKSVAGKAVAKPRTSKSQAQRSSTAKSKAAKPQSIQSYLYSLPADRRKIVEQIRKLVNDHLSPGYEEAFNWNMITWQVPLETYPETYNDQPLMFAGLSATKDGYSFHLMCSYEPTLRKRLLTAPTKSGKKLDMGKACIRFKSPDDLPLVALGDIVAAVTLPKFIAFYEKAKASRK
jgi:hypothetical protein